MPEPSSHTRALSAAALLILAGVVASGPLGTLLVQVIAPQPPWQDPYLYLSRYSYVQTIPFFFGFLLLGGFLLFFASLPKARTERERILFNLVLLTGGIYAFLVSLNYMLQVALLPHILAFPAMVELVTSQNPDSLFWYLEMTGYGFLGLATWCAAFLFYGNRRLNLVRYLLIVNGYISVAGTVLTYIFQGWVLTFPGFVSYLIWNILILTVMVLILAEYRFGRGPAGRTVPGKMVNGMEHPHE